MATIESYMLETPDKMKLILEKAGQTFKNIKDKKYDRIILAGSGTSYHAGVQAKAYMERMLKIEVSAVYPFSITDDYLATLKGKVLLVGISQGGASFSTYGAMEKAKKFGFDTASMCGTDEAFIDKLADYKLTVLCGEETAGAKTKGYHTTKLNLMLMSLYMALEQKCITEIAFNTEIVKIFNSVEKFIPIYEQSLVWIDENKNTFSNAKEIRIVGTADVYGDTLEAALKILETLRVPVTGYEFEEFIHGIYNAITEDSVVFVFDTIGEERVKKLVSVMSDWTDKIFIIGTGGYSDKKHLKINAAKEDFSTFNYIIPLQLICAKISVLKGVDPSIPKDPQFHMKLGSKSYNR